MSSTSSWTFLAKLAEDLTKNNENQVTARAAENMPKVTQEPSKNHPETSEYRSHVRQAQCPNMRIDCYWASIPINTKLKTWEHYQEGGGWGGVTFAARAAENMPIVCQKVRKSFKELQKLPKTCPRTGGLGGRSPPSKSSRKHQEVRKIILNHRKSSPGPQKSKPKGSW